MAHPENVNCLENMRCPNCGNMDRLIVTGLSSFIVTDDGAEQVGDIEYGPNAKTQCYECNYQAKWKDFENTDLRND